MKHLEIYYLSMEYSKMKNIFYVYIYLDPGKSGRYVYDNCEFDFEPFYVGKGKGLQHRSHLKQSKNNTDLCNMDKINRIRDIIKESNSDPIIIKYQENLNENDAFDLEIYLIENIGRIDLKTGPLTNKTKGGDGISGYIFTEEDKEKNSIRMKEYFKNPKNRQKQSELIKQVHKDNPSLATNHSKIMIKHYEDNPSARNDMSNKVQKLWEDQDYKNRQVNSHKKYYKNNSEEKENISKVQKKRFSNPKTIRDHSKMLKQVYKDRPELRNLHAKEWIVIDPQGKRSFIKNLRKFCIENNLDNEAMYLVAKGKYKQHKGWRCKKVKNETY